MNAHNQLTELMMDVCGQHCQNEDDLYGQKEVYVLYVYMMSCMIMIAIKQLNDNTAEIPREA